MPPGSNDLLALLVHSRVLRLVSWCEMILMELWSYVTVEYARNTYFLKLCKLEKYNSYILYKYEVLFYLLYAL
jgi:hypothetical protein